MLLLEHRVQVHAVALQEPPRHVVEPEADEVVAEEAAHQELGREVVDALDVVLLVLPLGSDPALHEAVADRVRGGLVHVEHRGRARRLHGGVEQVVEHRAPHRVGVHAGAVVLDDHAHGRLGRRLARGVQGSSGRVVRIGRGAGALGGIAVVHRFSSVG